MFVTRLLHHLGTLLVNAMNPVNCRIILYWKQVPRQDTQGHIVVSSIIIPTLVVAFAPFPVLEVMSSMMTFTNLFDRCIIDRRWNASINAVPYVYRCSTNTHTQI